MKRNRFFLLFLLTTPTIFFACKKDSSSTTLVGNWTFDSQRDGSARSGAVCFTIADTAYVGLGYNSTLSGAQYLSDFYKYDTINNWRPIASPGSDFKPRAYGVAFSIDKKGYIGTGSDDYKYYNDFWEYDQPTNKWRKVASLPGTSLGRRSAIAFNIGNFGYVGTGYNGSYLNDFWKFDPQASDTGGWTSITSMKSKRAFAMAFVINGFGYVLSGSESGSTLNDLWKFDPSNSRWIQMRNISNSSSQSYDDAYGTSIQRAKGVGFALNGLGYVSCGSNYSLTNTTWEYNPVTDLWTQKTNFEGSSREEAVSFTINNKAFVGCGVNGSVYDDDFWSFKPFQTYDANN